MSILQQITSSVGVLSYVASTLLYGQEATDVDVFSLPAESIENEVETVYELDAFTVVAERYGDVGDFSLISAHVVEAAELQRLIQTTLGETLAWEPGLNASYFGPGASRPIIRGLGDYRVRMLIDDIGTLDVSDNSPDHGIPLEPLLIRRVDVHRGPDALLFGNAAIGGAINSQTRNLPENLPEEDVSGTLESRYESGSDSRSAAVYATARAGDFALRLTSSRRQADDYAISGRARSDEYESTFTPEINNPSSGVSEPILNPSGSVPNTHIDTETASVGVLWQPLSSRGRLGIAYSRYKSAYGIPYQFGGDPNELFGDTSLDMQQSRLDLDASWELETERLERVRLRFGHADYGHEETFTGRAKDSDKLFEDTIMDLDSMEARVDFYHRLFDGLEGVGGIHGFKRELNNSRLAAPPILNSRVNNEYETENLGYFLVESLTFGDWIVRGGYRYEKQSINDTSLKSFGITRGETEESHSFAVGVTWRDYDRLIFDEVALTANISRIERLPSETERYAFWSNPAIQRFIIGADNTGIPLEVEQSNAVEFGLELHRGSLSGRLNLYRYEFTDFIFLQDIKGIGNLSQYVAKDAVFEGGEAELTWLVHRDSKSSLRLKGMIDWVRAENLNDNTNLPRIPPLRIGSRVEYERGALELGMDLRYAFKQDRVQQETSVVLPELETNAYFELNLDANYAWTFEHGELSLFARASNLLDAERRTHVSFLKDVAPLPGRNLSLGVRWQF